MRRTSHLRLHPRIHFGVCWSWLVAAGCSLPFLMSQGHTDTGSGSIYTRRAGKYYRSRLSAGEPVVNHSPAHHGHSVMGRGGFAMPGLWGALVWCHSRVRVEQGDPFGSSPRERTTVLVWESHISKVNVTLIRSLHLSELHL